MKSWNDLRVFLAFADSGSMAGAARQLGQNHSTVFRRLNQLEDDLAVRLFERLPTGYVMTPAGERMLVLAREAENAMNAIEREVAGRDLKPAGTVRLTTAATLARTLMPEVIRKVRRQYPDIVVELVVGDSDYDLNRREADIAFRATRKPPDHLVGRRLADLEWRICAGQALRNLPDSMASLSGHPLIGGDAAMLRLPAFQWLAENHGEQIVARSNDLSTMASLARSGVGLALLPSDYVEKGIRHLFAVPALTGQLWLLTHPDLRRVRRIAAVWEVLVEHVESVQKEWVI